MVVGQGESLSRIQPKGSGLEGFDDLGGETAQPQNLGDAAAVDAQ